MPGTFSDSWKLTKTAFGLIADDRALLVFPLVGGLSILGVLALFLLGAFWLFPHFSGPSASTYEALALVLFLATYFGTSFVSVYATAALIGAATLKLEGRQPTAADGWRVARSRLGRLVVWSVITATVGLLIQLIASRVQGIGGAVIGLAGGAAWSVVTYFMIPVVLYENATTWASLKRSGHLFVSTFGRSLISNLVVGLFVGAGIVAAVVLGILGLFELSGGATALGFLLLGGAIAVGTVVALIGAAAEGILRAALYRYATTGKIDPDLLPSAYRLGGPPATDAPLA
ncbi:MAG TPA: DUF6159 family protein [Thermoplasmata archaeon]|nr:DUF6159 family protein [Thermoplasmata archaeon]